MNTVAADSDQQASVATFLQILQHLGWTHAREIDDAKCRDLAMNQILGVPAIAA
jgi:hypothetical protein